MQDQILVLVSYKNKILLTCVDSLFDESSWSFIGDSTIKSKYPLKSASRLIKSVTSLDSVSVNKALLSDESNDSVYHIRLDDNNVNSIVRNKGFRLEFYSFKEVEKLNLTSATKMLIKNFRNRILQLIED